MICDLLAIYEKNADGDTLLIDNYQLKEGLYFRLYGTERAPELLQVDRNYVRGGELEKFFRKADFYSQLVDMNKPVDPKKQIHTNNLYSLAFKAGSFIDAAVDESEFIESVKRYYNALRTPKKEDARMLKEYGFSPIDESDTYCKQEYVIGFIPELKRHIVEYKLKANQYVKLYFSADMADYVRESKRYLIPKIFNKNDYNVAINGTTFGLSNSNMGLNSKKPFLEHKTTAFKVPFRISAETALAARGLLIWLDSQKDDQGKSVTSGYLPLQSSRVFALEKRVSAQTSAYFLHIEKGTQPVIEDYDFLPGLTENMRLSFRFENYLCLDDCEPAVLAKVSELEAIVDECFFNKNLVRNYYNKAPKPNAGFSAFQVDLMFRYKDAMHNYFRKGDEAGFRACIYDLSQSMLTEMLRQEKFWQLESTKIARGINLRLSLYKYWGEKGREDMGDRLVAMAAGLKAKLVEDKSDDNKLVCENDQEFYYYAGQLARYLISKSQAYRPSYDILNDLKNMVALKNELIRLHNKYKYAIATNNRRYNQLQAAVMAYECDDPNLSGFDMFMAGLTSKNIIYSKGEKEEQVHEDE